MKKNKALRAASALLVLTLLTTSIIGGTFAKYTTSDSAADTARVAEWGVTLQVSGNLYGKAYTAGNLEASKPVAWKSESETGQSVISAGVSAVAADNLLAPGTQSDAGPFEFKLTGTPEVASQTKVKITTQNIFLKKNDENKQYGLMVPVKDGELTNENFVDIAEQQGGLYTYETDTYKKVDTGATKTPVAGKTYYTLEDAFTLSKNYYPIVYKLTGDTKDEDGTIDTDSLKEVAETILKKVKSDATFAVAPDTCKGNGTAVSESIPPNTDLSNKLALNDEIITWSWAYGNGTDADRAMYDGADTVLGNLQAGLLNGGVTTTACVVKGNDTDGYTVLVAPAEGATPDYSLQTQFDIEITVEQVD